MPLVSLKTIKAQDVELYYSGAYVLLKSSPDEKGEWLKCDGWGDEGLYFSDGTKDQRLIKEWKNFYIESKFPVGWFNFKDTCVLCKRIPIRNVQQGISGNNFVTRPISELQKNYGHFAKLSKEMAIIALNSSPFTKNKYLGIPLLRETQNPEYPLVSEIAEKVRRGEFLGRALSKDFAVAPHYSKKGLLVFLDWKPVAEITSKDSIEILEKESFIEVYDFFSNCMKVSA